MWDKAGGRWVMLIVLAFSLPFLLACETEPQPQPKTKPAATAGNSTAISGDTAPNSTAKNGAAAPLASAQSPLSQKQIAEEAARAAQPVILAMGDSLTAGFGLAEEESYPARLQMRLKAAGYPHRVVNAGVSGDTSAGGLARLEWLMRQHPNIIILALGANDGLRGVKPSAMRANLAAIIEGAQAAGTRVLLVGMRMPSNYGTDYRRRFKAVFEEIAAKYDLPLLPFLLEGVALHRDLNQADGMHPNTRGTAIVTDNVWKALEPLLER